MKEPSPGAATRRRLLMAALASGTLAASAPLAWAAIPPVPPGSTPVLPALYMGQSDTRGRLPANHLSGAAGQWQMTRAMRWAGTGLVHPIAVFPNYYIDSSCSEVAGGTGTIKVSLEYPAGTFTLSDQCIAAGSAAVAFTPGNNLHSFSVFVPKGAQFWYRPLIQGAGIIPYTQYQTAFDTDPSEGWESGTGAVDDKTTSGSVTNNNAFTYGPIVTATLTRNPSVLILGDSREDGFAEAITDETSDVGITARAVGRQFGYSVFALAATSQTQYNAATRTFRDALVAAGYWSHMTNEYGVNDITASVSPASLATLRAACAAFYPNVTVIGLTIDPHNASSDGWATLANQTTSAANTQNGLQFNQLVRAGIAGEKFFWDAADLVDPNRRGLWPVDLVPSDTAQAVTCQCTGGISGTTFTVSAIASGSLVVGASLTDSLTTVGAVASGTTIVKQLTGSAGSTGTYQVSLAYSGYPFPSAVGSRTIYAAGVSTVDGLHGTPIWNGLRRDRGAPELVSMMRRI